MFRVLDELDKKPETFRDKIETAWWSFYHWSRLSSIWRFKPYFIWQHLTRGFPEHHLWSLDHHLSEHIAPRLRAFADYTLHGYPHDYLPDKHGIEDTTVSFMHWKRDLKKLAFAFEKLADENKDWIDAADHWKGKMSEEETAKWLKVTEVRGKFIQDNLVFFGKYYSNLWD